MVYHIQRLLRKDCNGSYSSKFRVNIVGETGKKLLLYTGNELALLSHLLEPSAYV